MTESQQKLAPPTVEVVGVSGSEALVRAASEVEMLVVPKMSGQRLSSFAAAIDEATGGLISQNGDLVGHAGSKRLLAFEPDLKPLGKLRYILLVGLGDATHFHRERACGLIHTVMSDAVVQECESVGLLISPNRLTDENLSLRAVAAVIHCRLQVFANDARRVLPATFKLFCAPQAKRYLESGLQVSLPLCQVCTRPELG